MKNNVYVIYDGKAEVYSLPIVYSDDLTFKRSVISACIQKPEVRIMVKDCDYLCIGVYDTDTGIFDTLNPQSVFTGRSIIEEVKQYEKDLYDTKIEDKK